MDKITREHQFFALDVTPEQEEQGETVAKVRELLETAKKEGKIVDYHFNWNFDEDVTAEHK